MRKLKNQQIRILEFIKQKKHNKQWKEDSFFLDKEIEKMKKVRLIEESIGYEDLALMDNFSDDELTCEL